MRKRARRESLRRKLTREFEQTLSSNSPPAPIAVPVAATKPWYHEGIQFGCTGCGACCRRPGYVWLSAPDLTRLAGHLGLPIDEFRRRYTRTVIIDGQDEPGVCLTKAAHGCIFLDDATNACKVHAARPTQCRIFPFWPMALQSPEAWQREVGDLCGREALEQGPIYTVDQILALSSHIVAVAPVPAGERPKQGDLPS
jgi:Fe-S-cluster containining protein